MNLLFKRVEIENDTNYTLYIKSREKRRTIKQVNKKNNVSILGVNYSAEINSGENEFNEIINDFPDPFYPKYTKRFPFNYKDEGVQVEIMNKNGVTILKKNLYVGELWKIKNITDEMVNRTEQLVVNPNKDKDVVKLWWLF
jgi:hypothetical protein